MTRVVVGFLKIVFYLILFGGGLHRLGFEVKKMALLKVQGGLHSLGGYGEK